MSTYKTITPREKYNVVADNKNDARKRVLEREKIQIEKIVEEADSLEIINLRGKLPYQRSVGTNKKNRINKVIVHHDGQYRPEEYSSLARYKAQAQYHISKGFGHIAYHYIIDNVGDVFQCLNVDDRAYHAGHWWTNLTSIAVKFDGNLCTQKLTNAQIESYKKLMVYLTTRRPDLPKVLKGSEKGHKEVARTACPCSAMRIIHKY